MVSKLTEKSWNLEINGYGSLQETYFFIEERKEILSRERVQASHSPHFWLLLKKRILYPKEQILLIMSIPQFPSVALSTGE